MSIIFIISIIRTIIMLITYTWEGIDVYGEGWKVNLLLIMIYIIDFEYFTKLLFFLYENIVPLG